MNEVESANLLTDYASVEILEREGARRASA